MRLATYEADGAVGVAVRHDGELCATPFGSMLDAIRAGDDGRRRLAAACRDGRRVGAARILAPVPRPGKLIFVGINYQGHIDENPDAVQPEQPFIFAKLATAVAAPDEPIVLPGADHQVDYEGELAVVIGTRARRVAPQDALAHVFGYTVINDVSARAMQFDHGQLTLGKGYDGFCPMGPELVLTDELPDPSDLRLTTRVNGELRQSASTAEMLFDIPELLAYVSTYTTLEPGDVVSTGTPGGVGYFLRPQRFLAPGDRIDVEIEGVGRLTSHVRAADGDPLPLGPAGRIGAESATPVGPAIPAGGAGAASARGLAGAPEPEAPR